MAGLFEEFEGQETKVAPTTKEPISTSLFEEFEEGVKAPAKAPIQKVTPVKSAVQVQSPKITKDGWLSTAWDYVTTPGEFDLKDLKEGGRSALRSGIVMKPLVQVGIARKALQRQQERRQEIQAGPAPACRQAG